jgi:hypothetical protein
MASEGRTRPVPRVPAPATSVSRRIQKAALLTLAGAAWFASAGAAVPANSSQIHLMVYSLGSALALIVAVRIAIKLFAYIIKTLIVLAVVGAVWTLAKLLADVLGLS